MKKTDPGTSVRIGGAGERAPLTPAQRQFNALIARIDTARKLLTTWKEAVERHDRKFASQAVPLYAAIDDLQADLVLRLDQASYDKRWAKRERALLSEIICRLARALLAERDDPALKAIYNTHSGADYDRDKLAEAQDLKAILEHAFDLELDDDPSVTQSTGSVFENARAKLAESRQESTEQPAADGRSSARRKSARERALEARQEADAKRVGQSLRAIYRKLVSALHPDRETDPVERARKTILMQRANQAYENNDLLRLLELQIELEHIDQAALADIGHERLQHYLTVLRGQLRELDGEIRAIAEEFRERFDLPRSATVSPRTIMRRLADDIRALEETAAALRREIRSLDGIASIKAWLREQRFD